MLLIAHRGLVDGPNEHKENRLTELARTLANGFDAELDLWWYDKNWWLGHDKPQYKITEDDIMSFEPVADRLWLHCKNIDALAMLKIRKWTGHYFYHQEDDVTITSTGYFWTYPTKDLTPYSIMLMPEWSGPVENCLPANCYGICSDYVAKLKNLL